MDILQDGNGASSHAFVAILVTLIVGAVICYIFQPALGQKPFDNDNIIEEPNHIESASASSVENESSNEGVNNSAQEGHGYLLSLIIPAYNEEERLPPMLESTLEYMYKHKNTIIQQCHEALGLNYQTTATAVERKSERKSADAALFQIIIVNDGSTDATVPSVQKTLHNISQQKRHLQNTASITILTLRKNAGKGAAVQAGMLHSVNKSYSKLCLMLDADGATTFSSLHSLLLQLKSNPDAKMAFGSRAHLQEASKAQRSFTRTLLMNAFHFFVECLVGNSVQDTQCGFKLFRGDVVWDLFHNLHLKRWAFDTELVVIAAQLGMQIAEVGVEWREVDGSKLHTGKVALIVASVGMLRDMICVRACYSLGLWKLRKSDKFPETYDKRKGD